MIILDPIDIRAPGVFVSSNVPEDDALPAPDPAKAYGAGERVMDPVSHMRYESKVGNNLNQPLTDKTYWLPIGATNRWKMLDEYNNTQTENPEVIILKVKPGAIVQGIFLGNLDATEIVITSDDPTKGVVYHETTSQVVFNTGGSFYKWLFGRRRFKKQFLTLALPPFWSSTLTIEIRKRGGIAKCGMCRLGPVEVFGLTQFGIGMDIKDFSSTKFNFDGTSETIERGFSKRMSMDVVLENELIFYAQDWLADRRQRVMVFIAIREAEWTALCGKYSSFKNVISELNISKMSLQIEGTV